MQQVEQDCFFMNVPMFGMQKTQQHNGEEEDYEIGEVFPLTTHHGMQLLQ
jgi:hypothetical protein